MSKIQREIHIKLAGNESLGEEFLDGNRNSEQRTSSGNHRRMCGDKEHLLSILIEIQRECRRNYINEASAKVVAEKLDIPLVQLYDILTFYAMLETKPRGRYIIEVCNNAPCYISKSHVMAKFLRKELGINFGETTPDGMFSLQYMPCVGACNIGPVIKIGDKVYGHLNEDRIRKILEELRENAQ